MQSFAKVELQYLEKVNWDKICVLFLKIKLLVWIVFWNAVYFLFKISLNVNNPIIFLIFVITTPHSWNSEIIIRFRKDPRLFFYLSLAYYEASLISVSWGFSRREPSLCNLLFQHKRDKTCNTISFQVLSSLFQSFCF